jgi:hypothetical protein
MAISFALVVLLPSVLGISLGIVALPVAMFVSAILLNPLLDWLVYRSLRLRLFGSWDLLTLVVQVLPLLVLYARQPTGSFALILVAAFLVCSGIPLLSGQMGGAARSKGKWP